MSRRVQPTQEEVNALPFNATDFEVYFNEETQVRSQFANWNDQQIQRYQQGPWENYHNDKPLTLDDWEKYYLSASHHVTLHPRPAVLPAPVAERAESAQGCS